MERAVRIVLNAKTQRPGVCHSCGKPSCASRILEEKFIPMIIKELKEKKVEIRGDEIFVNAGAVPASEEDWGTGC